MSNNISSDIVKYCHEWTANNKTGIKEMGEIYYMYVYNEAFREGDLA